MNKAGRIILTIVAGLAFMAGVFGLIYASNQKVHDFVDDAVRESSSLDDETSQVSSHSIDVEDSTSDSENLPYVTLSTNVLIIKGGAGFGSSSSTITATAHNSSDMVSWRTDPEPYDMIIQSAITLSGEENVISLSWDFNGPITLYACLSKTPIAHASCLITAENHADRAQLKDFSLWDTAEHRNNYETADFGLVDPYEGFGEGYFFHAENLQHTSKMLPLTPEEAIALPQAAKIGASRDDLVLALNVYSHFLVQDPFFPGDQKADTWFDKANSTWIPSNFNVSKGEIDTDHKYVLKFTFHLSEADAAGGLLVVKVDQLYYAFTLLPYVEATGVTVPGSTTVSS